LRRAAGAGLDGESVDRAIIMPPRCASSSDTVREIEYQILQFFIAEPVHQMLGPGVTIAAVKLHFRDAEIYWAWPHFSQAESRIALWRRSSQETLVDPSDWPLLTDLHPFSLMLEDG
jgi:hypothetical protein